VKYTKSLKYKFRWILCIYLLLYSLRPTNSWYKSFTINSLHKARSNWFSIYRELWQEIILLKERKKSWEESYRKCKNWVKPLSFCHTIKLLLTLYHQLLNKQPLKVPLPILSQIKKKHLLQDSTLILKKC
jgi:hypothetical protein